VKKEETTTEPVSTAAKSPAKSTSKSPAKATAVEPEITHPVCEVCNCPLGPEELLSETSDHSMHCFFRTEAEHP